LFEDRIERLETVEQLVSSVQEVQRYALIRQRLQKRFAPTTETGDVKRNPQINSNICLMLSVYKSFHQTLKYGRQRNRILQGFKV